MAKMTQEEIRIAGQAAKDAYYNEGYDAGKKIADQLEGEMIRRGILLLMTSIHSGSPLPIHGAIDISA